MQSFVENEVRMNKSEIDELAEKVGGRYRFTVLLQKRVKELTRGAVRLIESDAKNLIHVAMEEIKQGKVGIENGPEMVTKKKTKKKKS
ncbi:uncharacterized protein METZ01_LOCUS391008 [marine metagenome]|jgi:DNA-directed RNA polymerase omega subunit|uniref:DNA-directed RNA polymerase n=1 Tax=marine metagenome TaxID=408172 RepID=A0A382UV85_9ZZZZ|tara:strand:+ start:212 stop:475 length:264 start_codon:yes stop_codon:yes gene_type:complete